MTSCLRHSGPVVVSKRVITSLAWRLPCISIGGMRMRYTFEILAVALLMAAGSILRPATPSSGCNVSSATWGAILSVRNLAHPVGGRG